MNPQIALFVCAVFVCAALLIDFRNAPRVSSWLWIPTIWFVMVAAKPLGIWLGASGDLMLSADGSAIDRSVLLFLMFLATIVLARRSLPWAKLREEHFWILLFFCYCGVSLAWSEFPAVGIRRWIRSLGSVMMILVVATERDPLAAAATVMRRCAIVLLPISIILIKYFIALGVSYDFWTGERSIVGVATDKNSLGRISLLCGLFLFWEILTRKKHGHVPKGNLSHLSAALLLLCVVWLLKESDSQTSIMCFLVGALAITFSARPWVKGRAPYLGTWVLVLACFGLLLNWALGITDFILLQLGRDPTLTDRTFIWNDLLALGTNSIIGVGYNTFWLGDRLAWFVENYRINSAHNGYLEVYLELGLVGVSLLGFILLSIFRILKRALVMDESYARLLAGILSVFVLYNWAESNLDFKRLVFLTLLMVAACYPRSMGEITRQSGKTGSESRQRSMPVPANSKQPGRLSGSGKGQDRGVRRSGSQS